MTIIEPGYPYGGEDPAYAPRMVEWPQPPEANSALPLDRLDPYDRRVAEANPDALYLNRGAYTALRQQMSRFATITEEQFRGITGLSPQQSDKILKGFQCRQLLSSTRRKDGSFDVYPPEGSPEHTRILRTFKVSRHVGRLATDPDGKVKSKADLEAPLLDQPVSPDDIIVGPAAKKPTFEGPYPQFFDANGNPVPPGPLRPIRRGFAPRGDETLDSDQNQRQQGTGQRAQGGQGQGGTTPPRTRTQAPHASRPPHAGTHAPRPEQGRGGNTQTPHTQTPGTKSGPQGRKAPGTAAPTPPAPVGAPYRTGSRGKEHIGSARKAQKPTAEQRKEPEAPKLDSWEIALGYLSGDMNKNGFVPPSVSPESLARKIALTLRSYEDEMRRDPKIDRDKAINRAAARHLVTAERIFASLQAQGNGVVAAEYVRGHGPDDSEPSGYRVLKTPAQIRAMLKAYRNQKNRS